MTPLVLLSGWGIDARIWQPLAPYWPPELAVSAPDWPGYGSAAESLDASDDPERLAARMATSLPAEAVWVGWSLGALLATRLLAQLPTPRGVVLLGMGGRFCSEGGVTATELRAFRNAFRRSPTATWQHFLRWQLQGEPAPRPALRRLQELIGRRPSATPATLERDLAQLAALDNRAILASPPCPVHRLAGSHDPLLGDSDRRALDHAFEAAGHCPMLSCPAELATRLTEIARVASRSATPESQP
ncbi:alpha/beta fold hydrolase [Halomonas campisalis]|uniref:Alpha/beta fold hydrolase n=1 Tax=Billgrantia campisalis TaxID=74661 RepID=A0ABS9P3Q5_9GAMM|nr:alpha/beta fold hydrolase [Halomonas campisalis]MCG6656417.1 alpha/beta fold hydrolase [Halomonas campisalis]MDR5861603.1 alpha/beta fold hydrolase [Halomonas campisalis]